ncbi:glycine cleavage system protein T [Cephaloticoccus primus]|uniref:Aminomethyltransferase n=1 Tax=Cephaloticoccus primus TaxID=1548207 RepID=A0A139SIJ8_9BACT|nr:glycine cleavage system aminomethyltransferase GcvT [Cephaloticoccus primus]KXU34377.1 glycine cleavage system protein T [Cephaloticoccus primus]
MSLKRTPLRDFHAEHGARLVDFAGWEMPVQYRSILEEHKAVRHAAGLFDVSHMGEFEVQGPQARALLDHLVTNDVSKMSPGRVLYTPMCYERGTVIDDLLIYMRSEEDFLLCVNAGNIDKDLAWIRERAAAFGGTDSDHGAVSITDRSADTALLALQGPAAAAILQPLTAAPLDALRYYHFTTGQVAGIDCVISRTGYTGEDGFELYHASGAAVDLARALLDAGRPHGLELAGLGARDSLRLEAGYPLYGHEISDTISPLTGGLGWTVKLDKAADFIGRAALLVEKQQGSAQRLVFFKTGDRRIVRAEAPVFGAGEAGGAGAGAAGGESCGRGGAAVGRVASGTLSPILGEAIGTALVSAAAAASARSGTAPLWVDIRGTRLDLQLVKAPFVTLKKTS